MILTTGNSSLTEIISALQPADSQLTIPVGLCVEYLRTGCLIYWL